MGRGRMGGAKGVSGTPDIRFAPPIRPLPITHSQ